MSALEDGEARLSEDGANVTFSFKQCIPIPSYLLALAVGVLESKKIGPRTAVWSEAEILDGAAWEFSGTETFLKAAEDLVIFIFNSRY